MKSPVAALCLVAIGTLAGCTSAREVEPIPGSITYGGQPRTKLTKSPVGSVVYNRLRDDRNRELEETYIVQPDRSLRLVGRRVVAPDDGGWF